jgi:hypothetical protein
MLKFILNFPLYFRYDLAKGVDMSLSEIGGGGLQGYIDVWFPTNPQYQHGASFYVPVWSLQGDKALNNYQIGLPSTWYIPNNDNFPTQLCPAGTDAHDWTNVGLDEFVFQTMEGGLGNWGGMIAPTAAPKFQIGGTSNCYTTTTGSPGWGSNGYQATLGNMGTAQLSNRIIFPPDGLTFAANTSGQLGVSYMPIPMRPKQTSPEPTGDQAWTLFLNSKNFAGPVAFYIPNFWSKLSQSYKAIKGRGLDALPAIMETVAMEVNTVPYFQANDSSGTTYTRIPPLSFPVDSNGNTILAQGVYLYSANAFYNPMENALTKGTALPTTFNASSATAVSPTCSAEALSFTQGSTNIPLTGIDKTVQTYTSTDSQGRCVFGLKWANAKGTGVLPEYYRQSGTNRVAVSASSVPANTRLQAQTFSLAGPGDAKTVPSIESNKNWNNWVPNQPAVTVKLIDGSTVVYRWYKFVDQPAIKHLGLTAAQANHLQATVEKMHSSWNSNHSFMPPLPSGELVNLDPALFVPIPKGVPNVGYVPVVTSQSVVQASQQAAQISEQPAATQQTDVEQPDQQPANQQPTAQQIAAQKRALYMYNRSKAKAAEAATVKLADEPECAEPEAKPTVKMTA